MPTTHTSKLNLAEVLTAHIAINTAMQRLISAGVISGRAAKAATVIATLKKEIEATSTVPLQ